MPQKKAIVPVGKIEQRILLVRAAAHFHVRLEDNESII